jgi:sigma-B regulation protein RsbU (phosphoserine phosphatase)
MPARPYLRLRARLTQAGWPPRSRVGRIAFFLLAVDFFLFLLEKVLVGFRISSGNSLAGWVSFLTFASATLFSGLLFRWVRDRVLWRLRNRLIVTYVFIGVIPLILLVTLALTAFYLFAGQFATFIVTTGLSSELKSLQAANSAIAHDLGGRMQAGAGPSVALQGLRQADANWRDRQISAYLDGNLALNSSPISAPAPPLPAFLKDSFQDVVRDHDQLYLRVADTVNVGGRKLVVLSTEPLDRHLLEHLASNLGEITLYPKGLTLRKLDQGQSKGNETSDTDSSVRVKKPDGDYVLDTGKEPLGPGISAGSVPAATRSGDRLVSFVTTVFVVNWETGCQRFTTACSKPWVSSRRPSSFFCCSWPLPLL